MHVLCFWFWLYNGYEIVKRTLMASVYDRDYFLWTNSGHIQQPFPVHPCNYETCYFMEFCISTTYIGVFEFRNGVIINQWLSRKWDQIIVKYIHCTLPACRRHVFDEHINTSTFTDTLKVRWRSQVLTLESVVKISSFDNLFWRYGYWTLWRLAQWWEEVNF